MDLRESMWDSTKVFREDLRVQLAAKLFYLETFMAYGINSYQEDLYDSLQSTMATLQLHYYILTCNDWR